MFEKLGNAGAHDQIASQYSKNAIFLWCISGVVYIWLSDSQRIASLVTGLLFLPGIFVASFAAIPIMFADTKVKEAIARVTPYDKLRAFGVLAVTSALRVSFFVVQILLPIVFVKLCAKLL